MVLNVICDNLSSLKKGLNLETFVENLLGLAKLTSGKDARTLPSFLIINSRPNRPNIFGRECIFNFCDKVKAKLNRKIK
jgi:hypothetical protein